VGSCRDRATSPSSNLCRRLFAGIESLMTFR
jgi:hypothetical protein